MTASHEVFLSLGSNIGDRIAFLKKAVTLIASDIGHIARISSMYESEPWNMDSKNGFVNIAVHVTTTLTPRALLTEILAIEKHLGRSRTAGSEGYSDRAIDIDILLFDDIVIEEDQLNIPHLAMMQRRFVLAPLAELAPDKVDPIYGRPMSEWLRQCKDVHDVKKTDPFPVSYSS